MFVGVVGAVGEVVTNPRLRDALFVAPAQEGFVGAAIWWGEGEVELVRIVGSHLVEVRRGIMVAVEDLGPCAAV